MPVGRRYLMGVDCDMEMDGMTIVLLVLVVLFFGGTGLFVFINWVRDFRSELQSIQREIERCEPAERRYWIRQKRRLWASLLPFVKY